MVIHVQWMQAVIDLPDEGFDTAAAFWAQVTGSTLGSVHPDHPEFVHLKPPSGDMDLELQRIDDGPASVHLDLLVDNIEEATQAAIGAGAECVAAPGHAVLRTPGGVRFCLVPFSSESRRRPLIGAEHPNAADQLCLDVPGDAFGDEVAFWQSLTGWPANPPVSPEFRSFAQPPGQLPIRLLIQRLGRDDSGPARGHLDFACGPHVAAVTEQHLKAGAKLDAVFGRWSALRDPIGQPYCLTVRLPHQF